METEQRGEFAKYVYIYILAAESLFQIENLKRKLARRGEKNNSAIALVEVRS